MSALNTNTLSIDYTLEENTGATRTAQIYTEVDGEIVDVMNIHKRQALHMKTLQAVQICQI